MADANLTKAQALAEAIKQRWRDVLNTLYGAAGYIASPSAPPYFWANFEAYDDIDTYGPATFVVPWTSATVKANSNITFSGGGNTQLQPSVAGVYRITVHCQLEVQGQWEETTMSLKKNGVVVDTDTLNVNEVDGTWGAWGDIFYALHIDVIIPLTTSDYITLTFDDECEDYYTDTSLTVSMTWLGYDYSF